MSSTPNNSTTNNTNNNSTTPSKKNNKKKMNSSATGDINIKFGRGSMSPKRENSNAAPATPNRENNNGEATTPQPRPSANPTGAWASPKAAVIEDENSPGRDKRDDAGTSRSNDSNSTADQQDEVQSSSQPKIDDEFWRQWNEMNQKIPALQKEVARIPSLEKEVARIPFLEKEVARIPFLEGEIATVNEKHDRLEERLEKLEGHITSVEIVRVGEPMFMASVQDRYLYFRDKKFKTLRAISEHANAHPSRWEHILESEDRSKPGLKLRDLKVLVPALQHFRDERNKACHEMIVGRRTQSKENIEERIRITAPPRDVERLMKIVEKLFGELVFDNPSPQKPKK